jgi:hypothetical protein
MDHVALQDVRGGSDADAAAFDSFEPPPGKSMNATLTPESLDRVTEPLATPAPTLVVPGVDTRTPLPLALRVVHVAIIANLLVQCVYGAFQVFWVLQPPGTIGPMFGHATEIPFELMMARRMYALESWVAFLGLALYVGVTEILPRRWRP